jgi:hypothetical protein
MCSEPRLQELHVISAAFALTSWAGQGLTPPPSNFQDLRIISSLRCQLKTHTEMAAYNTLKPHKTTSIAIEAVAGGNNELASSSCVHNALPNLQPLPNLTFGASNFQNSRLLRLPAELRNQIYGYASTNSTFQRVAVGGSTASYTSTIERRQHQTALLLVCRQIYEEAHHLLFQTGFYSFPAPETYATVEPDMVKRFFTPEKRAAIKNVHVQKWCSVYISLDQFKFEEAKDMVKVFPGLKILDLDIRRYVLGPEASGPFPNFNQRKASFEEWVKARGVELKVRVIAEEF